MLASIAGVPAFLAYCVAGLVLVTLFVAIYIRVTPHNELALIRDDNVAAAASLGMAIVGYSIPLASAMRYTASIWDLAIWGIFALIVQIMIHFVVRLVLPDWAERIERNELAAAIFAGSASIAGGTLNAVAMSY